MIQNKVLPQPLPKQPLLDDELLSLSFELLLGTVVLPVVRNSPVLSS